MQLLQRTLGVHTIVERLEPLLKPGVHIVGVDAPRVDLGEVWIDVVGDVFSLIAARTIRAQIGIALRENGIGPRVKRQNLLHVEPVHAVIELLPREPLNLGSLEVNAQLTIELGKLRARRDARRQRNEPLDVLRLEHVAYPRKRTRHRIEVLLELAREQPLRLVAGIQVERVLDVAAHRMRVPVVAHRPRRLVATVVEHAVGTRERLDQALVPEHLIEVERIHPF